MEFLNSGWFVALSGAVGVPLIIYLWNLLLPRTKVYDFGYKMMSALMAFSFEKVGESSGRKLIISIENTLTDLTSGMHDATIGQYKGKDPKMMNTVPVG